MTQLDAPTLTAEQALAFILDHECYNPDEPFDQMDINRPETWARRRYRIEGHCVNYLIVAAKTTTGYSVISIEAGA
jgi:hypothetical protein